MNFIYKHIRYIFISGINTAPLSVDLENVIAQNKETFQKGLSVLSKLTDGKIYFVSNHDRMRL